VNLSNASLIEHQKLPLVVFMWTNELQLAQPALPDDIYRPKYFQFVPEGVSLFLLSLVLFMNLASDC